MHTDMTTYYIEEPQQKCRLGKVTSRLLGWVRRMLKHALLVPNPYPLLLRSFKTFGLHECFLTHLCINTIHKSRIRLMMNQRWGLDRNNVLWHLEIPGVSNNTTQIPEQKETTFWAPNDQETACLAAHPIRLNLRYMDRLTRRGIKHRPKSAGSSAVNAEIFKACLLEESSNIYSYFIHFFKILHFTINSKWLKRILLI